MTPAPLPKLAPIQNKKPGTLRVLWGHSTVWRTVLVTSALSTVGLVLFALSDPPGAPVKTPIAPPPAVTQIAQAPVVQVPAPVAQKVTPVTPVQTASTPSPAAGDASYGQDAPRSAQPRPVALPTQSCGLSGPALPLRVKPGQTLADIQAAYPDAPAEIPFVKKTAGFKQPPEYQVRLCSSGIWFFLDEWHIIKTIRLEPPYNLQERNGAVFGASKEMIVSTFGPGRSTRPANWPATVPWTMSDNYIYQMGSDYRMNLQFNTEDKLSLAFMFR